MKLASAKVLTVPSTDTDPLTILNKVMYPYLVRDRFNYLSSYSNFNFINLATCPRTVLSSKSLPSRGEDILKKAGNKKIAFIADNHLDTTAALLALYSVLPNPEQLTVFSEDPLDNSVDTVISSRKVVSDAILEDLEEESYGAVVFGFSGSSLFIPELLMPGLKNYSWEDGLMRSLEHSLTEPKKEKCFEAYKGYADYLGLDLRTFGDLGYLFNFGCKWSLIRDLPSLYLYKTRNQNRGIHFYDTPEFEQLSKNIFEESKGNNTIRYRSFLGSYIFEKTGDRSYLTKLEKYDPYRLAVSEDPVIRVRTNTGIKLYKSSADECSPCFKRLSLNIRESFRK